MNIEDLCEMSASELEAMDDATLLKHFESYLLVTRPENAPKQQTKEQRVMTANPKLAQAKSVAAKLGIDIDLSLLTYRKKK